jgi:GH25 family lysozyme M1 (1,4-beta-N-acetylmuramidase)
MITTAQFGGVASAQLIDVANYQGAYDWAAAKRNLPGLAGGIFKVTEGLTFIDQFAQHNHDGIAAVGLAARGMYHFLRPGVGTGRAQAQFFAAKLRSLGLSARDMLWCDNEDATGGPAHVSAFAGEFMNELHSQFPRNPKGVYSNVSFDQGGYDAGLGRWPWWAAHPGSAPAAPPVWARWTFWQWGIRRGVDADAFNGTIDQLTTWLSSFAAPVPKPVPDPQVPPARNGWVTGNGKATLRQIAHQAGGSVLDIMICTIGARAGMLGSGERALFSQLANDADTADKPVPDGVLIRVSP